MIQFTRHALFYDASHTQYLGAFVYGQVVVACKRSIRIIVVQSLIDHGAVLG
jgi:hypothetical protein